MPKIKINDISMYYEIHGQGEPIIFVAGFSVDHTMWYEIINKFSDKYQLILFDNRGSGQTDVPHSLYSIDEMTKDVVDLCTALEIKQANFVGNSMGRFIVQTLAFRYPQLIKSAVISNSATSFQCCFQIYVDAQLEFIKANTPLTALSKAISSWIFSYHYLSQPGNLNFFIKISQENAYPFTIQGYKGQYAALCKFDSTNWINKIDKPILVMSGEQDLIFSATSTKSLANQIPNAQYYCFPQCGHLPPIEYP